ncbi:hypothetical protein [Streptosporangium sp. NPDC051022]|uniref:hypothetical protein n=1 Tax=Streptosporangium sp. NPDC051022 TaxID=3155752 RepID=UPI00342217C5
MSSGEQQACPVCGAPAREDPSCARCGRQLSGGWRLGGLGERDREEYAAGLRAARVRFDLAPALRAGEGTGRPERFERFVRDSPSAAEREEARRTLSGRRGAAVTADEPLTRMLAELVDGGLDLVRVVECGADGLDVEEVRADELGAPRLSRRIARLGWERVFTGLSADPDERRFQLAGGWRGAEPAPDLGLPEVPASHGARTGTLLVDGAPGWPLPARALRALRERLPDARVAEGAVEVPARRLLSVLVSEAPLRHDYHLVLSGITPSTGAVRLFTRKVFSAGGDGARRVGLRVRGPRGRFQRLALAVVVPGGSTPGSWLPVAVGATRLEPGARAELRLLLRGPGQVDMELTGGDAVEPVEWDTLLAALPGRLDPSGLPFDLICAVELGGAAGQVEARLRWTRELLQAVAGTDTEPGHGRVAVFGYTDHLFERGARNRRVVQGAWLRTPREALHTLAKLEPSPAVSAVAPIEDMLYELVRRLPGRDPGRRPILVTVGERQPHVGSQRGSAVADALPCPSFRDWRRLLGRFQEEPGAAGVAVVGGSRRAGEAWHEIGFTRLTPLAETDAHTLAKELGMLSPPAHPFLFPTPDTE